MRPIIPQILVRILKRSRKRERQVLHRRPMLVKQGQPLARGGPGAVDAVDLDAVAGGRDVEVPAVGYR